MMEHRIIQKFEHHERSIITWLTEEQYKNLQDDRFKMLIENAINKMLYVTESYDLSPPQEDANNFTLKIDHIILEDGRIVQVAVNENQYIQLQQDNDYARFMSEKLQEAITNRSLIFYNLSMLDLSKSFNNDKLVFSPTFCYQNTSFRVSISDDNTIETDESNEAPSTPNKSKSSIQSLSSNSDELLEEDEKNDYICGLCMAVFHDFKSARSHTIEKHNELICTWCTKKTIDMEDLDNHFFVHRKHAKKYKKSVTCPFCVRICPSLSLTKLHIKRKHPDKVIKMGAP